MNGPPSQSPRGLALVTGAGGLMGRAIAHRLFADGYSLLLTDLSAKSLAAAIAAFPAGVHVHGHVADLAKPSDLAALFAACDQLEERLAVLVNVAGIYINEPFREMRLGNLRAQIDLNLKAVFFAMQGAARRMIAGGQGGAIVNITSTSAHAASLTPKAGYDASKAGLRQLTASVAVELAPQGIRVNAIAPGHIASGNWGFGEDETMQRFLGRVPMQRLGTGDDIAGAVSFLASGDGAYVTGQTLAVDGGFLGTLTTPAAP